MGELAFDQVTIRMKAGVNLLSPEEWMEIPTLEQFDLVMAKRVEFLLGGEKVSLTKGIQSAKAYRQAREG